MKVLFVCSGNLSRSPTAEALFGHCEGFEVKSAGTSMSFPTPLDANLVWWADVIFAMEEEHEKAIARRWPEASRKIRVLNIRDIYHRHDPKLVVILKKKLAPFFTYGLR